jgi:hypothetical protein
MEKWAQGLSWPTVRQQYEPALADLSRPDCVSLWEGSAVYSLDKFDEMAYLRLSGDQDQSVSVANCFEENVQLIGV